MAATAGANVWCDTADGGASDSDSDTLSPEDAAWVDSCLVKDDDGDGDGDHHLQYDGESPSDESWTALTEAFITALASASGAAGPSVPDEDEAGGSSSTGGACREASSSFPANTLEEDVFMSQAGPVLEGASSDLFAQEGSDGRLDKAAAVVIGNEYPDEPGYGGDADADDDFIFLLDSAGKEVDEVDLTRDVFRVWDLDVPHEHEEEGGEEEDEGELSRQLKKALEGSSVGAMTPPPPVPVPVPEDRSTLSEEWNWEDDDGKPGPDGRRVLVSEPMARLDDVDLEELIAGVDDMSLGPSSRSPVGSDSQHRFRRVPLSSSLTIIH